MNEPELRALARKFFEIGVKAADPAAAVRRELIAHPIHRSKGRLVVIAFGKAAIPMIEEALRHTPDGERSQAIAVSNYENAKKLPGVRVHAAGHPVPDVNGLQASKDIQEQLQGLGASDQVLFLISGGGSALLPAPSIGLTLQDKIETNKLLLSSGLDITQMNLVRQQLSRFKGGGLATICYPARTRSLVISDVIGDDPNIIASGPTAKKVGTKCEAQALLRTANVWDQLPKAVQDFLNQKENDPAIAQTICDNKIIASNRQSLDAIAHAAADWQPVIVNDRLDGDVGDAANHIIDFIRSQQHNRPRMYLWGGETTVKLTGTGLGGRNQELALRVASGAAQLPGQWAFLSGGTDGRDGPTDAAGGIVTPSLTFRAGQAGLNIAESLAKNDSYHALQAMGDLLVTGPTGTNVADIQIFLQAQ